MCNTFAKVLYKTKYNAYFGDNIKLISPVLINLID